MKRLEPFQLIITVLLNVMIFASCGSRQDTSQTSKRDIEDMVNEMVEKLAGNDTISQGQWEKLRPKFFAEFDSLTKCQKLAYVKIYYEKYLMKEDIGLAVGATYHLAIEMGKITGIAPTMSDVHHMGIIYESTEDEMNDLHRWIEELNCLGNPN